MLVVMTHLYDKVAVASVCTALSFALVANQEAKAATLGYRATTTFFIENFPRPDTLSDYISYGNGDRLYTHLEGNHSFIVMKTRFDSGEKRSFHEFSIGHLSLIKNAIFSIRLDSEPGGYYPSWNLQVRGYVGNGIADLSDYGSGVYLDSESPKYPDRIQFDVTQFVKKLISNHDDFAGFGISIGGKAGKVNINNTYYEPLLTIETADVAEPVPEPTTIFGSALALSLGGWLKRKKSSQQNKTTPQY
jgi:hypothetical protein